MSRALKLGVADYIPISAITTKLPRTLRRVLKCGSGGDMQRWGEPLDSRLGDTYT